MRRHVHTEIEINAPASIVWAALTDFEQLGTWNDFMLRIDGEKAVGAKWTVELKLGQRKPMIMRPKVMVYEPGQALRWLGRLGIPGLFDGEHGFVLEPIGDARVRFVHEERFSGLLVRPMLWMIGDALLHAFEALNRALKARAEAQLASTG
jgi:hypothetical protein